jgi:hypothetical protein
MIKDRCDELKEKFYECARKLNLKFNPDILKGRVSDLKDHSDIKIDEEIFKKCPIINLGRCLNAKYEVESINEKNLYDYFDNKYIEYDEQRVKEGIEKNKNLVDQSTEKYMNTKQ